MESLGLGSTAPKSDGRIKSLLWPTIRHDGDLEQITEQGFWICLIVGLLSFVVGMLGSHAFASLLALVFYFLAGIGVRQRSKAASIIAFIAYLASALVGQRWTGNGFGVVTIIFLGLLLANVRGIWLSARWTAANDLPHVPRLNETFMDKLSGHWPEVLWPKTKWLFALVAGLELLGLSYLLFGPRPPVM